MGLKMTEKMTPFKMGLKKESVWGVPPDSQGGGAPWLHGTRSLSFFNPILKEIFSYFRPILPAFLYK